MRYRAGQNTIDRGASMDQPHQSFPSPNATTTELPLEVTVVSDAETTRRLSRVLALARLRSSYTWGFILLLPLILMSRRFIEIFIAANSPDWSVSSLIVSYLVLLTIAAVMGLLATGIQMLKRNASIAAYTSPGTPISARFQQDSLDLFLTTGTTTIPYDKIKDLITTGDGVFLREQGGRGRALPRDLFPPAAFELLGRDKPSAVEKSDLSMEDGDKLQLAVMGRQALGPDGEQVRPPATSSETPVARNDRKLKIAAVAGGIVLVCVLAIVAVSQRNSGTSVDVQATDVSRNSVPTSPVALPNPCALTPDEMQRFGFTLQVLNNDALTQHRCDWNTDRNSGGRQYDSARLFLRTERMADHSSPRSVHVGGVIDGQEFVVVDDPAAKHYVMCYVVWPTSYGFARSELHGYSVNGVDSDQLCRDAEELANVIAGHLS
ncbi:hypothetical protein ACIRRA_00295 [Nocardia sp. NPDC101769]|uniref:hypothetical protein n=1 Tax=Nocardia sp. NPDC101769 TaxID=3364333 RepID=UPI00381F5874